ncbi:MAG TPA: COR domain-containing protein [Saprospiraceae bacterium]|nr:COR domain-containing protein [Saprospiraceae bacterium]
MEHNYSVLIVDDDISFHKDLRDTLGNIFEFHGAKDVVHMRQKLAENQHYDLILLDLVLDETGEKIGLNYIKEILRTCPNIIVLTGHRNSINVAKAINLGAKAYYDKENLDFEEISLLIIQVIENPQIEQFEYPEVIKNLGEKGMGIYEEELKSGKKVMYEAKAIIVGDRNVGKTTLHKKIIGHYSNKYLEHYKDIDKSIESKRSSSVNISTWNYEYNSKEYYLHLWDFVNNQRYFIHYGLFLTENSIYFLVHDNTTDRPNLEYWLHNIEFSGKDSPVLIIENTKKDYINRKKGVYKVRNNFDNIKEILSCDFGGEPDTFDTFIENIKIEVAKFQHFRMQMPQNWYIIRKEIEKLAENRAYIDLMEYRKICQKHNLDNTDTDLLIDVLQEWGVIIRYKNIASLIDRYLFLQPDWLVNVVYETLDNLPHGSGYYTYPELREAANKAGHKDDLDIILIILEGARLCFKTNNKETRFVFPTLLNKKKPASVWSERTSDLRIIISFIKKRPHWIIHELMVKLHRYLISPTDFVWDNGFVLKIDGCEAVVEEGPNNHSIWATLRTSNADGKVLLQKIREAVDEYNSEMDINIDVRCLCKSCQEMEAGNQYYNILILERRLQKYRSITNDYHINLTSLIECHYSGNFIQIDVLLGSKMDLNSTI